MSISLETCMRYDDVAVEEPETESIVCESAPDAVLVERSRAGDQAAFEVLVRRYRNDVFALSYHFLRNREEAWDVSQEVFIKAYRALWRFRGDACFKTWLMRITANHCKDQLKKRRVDTLPFDETIETHAPGGLRGPEETLEAAELGAAIEQAIALLPAKHRTAFVLREYEGMSYQDMARVMRCNLGTVMSRLHHARRKLQNTLIGMGVLEDQQL